MKTMWKNFWTMKSKANAGFTLVELIVVIAILAILGGVAVPTYSGYIRRAKEAGDHTLLGAVNTAFAAACLDNGTDISQIESANIIREEGSEGWKVTGVDQFDESFKLFYGENKDAEFQVYESLQFDTVKKLFVNPSEAGVNIGYNGAVVYVSAEQIEALKDSSFYGENMTSEKLLQQVDNVAYVASGMGTIQNILGTPEFATFAMDILDVETPAEYEAKVNDLVLEKLGWDKEGFVVSEMTEAESKEYFAALDQIKGNALILYTAKQTSAMGDNAKNLLKDIDSETIKLNMYGSTAEQQQTGVNQAALAYGMYYAYLSSQGKDTSNIKPGDVTNALDNDTAFQKYLTEPQGQKDMTAYLEALKVIDQSATGNSAAVEQLVTNGFVDLNDILTGTMGK